MTTEKLKELIEEENVEQERALAQKARQIISSIAQSKACIAEKEQKIAELQTELRKLEATHIDAMQILGS